MRALKGIKVVNLKRVVAGLYGGRGMLWICRNARLDPCVPAEYAERLELTEAFYHVISRGAIASSGLKHLLLAATAVTGSVKNMRLPSPSVLSARIVPPWASTIHLEI